MYSPHTIITVLRSAASGLKTSFTNYIFPWLGYCVTTPVQMIMLYTRYSCTRTFWCVSAPLIMSVNAAPPIIAMVERFRDPNCQTDMTNQEWVHWLLTGFVSLGLLRSNYVKFARSSMAHAKRHFNLNSDAIAKQSWDPALNAMAIGITALANTCSFANVISTSQCAAGEHDETTLLITSSFLMAGGLFLQGPLLWYYFTDTSPKTSWGAWLISLAYSVPNTTQYLNQEVIDHLLGILGDVIKLPPSEIMIVALLFMLVCAGTAMQYRRNLAKDARRSLGYVSLDATHPTGAGTTNAGATLPDDVTQNISDYFFKKQIQGDALSLLLMGISVTVKTMAAWLALKNIFEQYSIPAWGIVLLNTFLGGVLYGPPQLARASEVA